MFDDIKKPEVDKIEDIFGEKNKND